jgi:Autotransporter beta-domain
MMFSRSVKVILAGLALFVAGLQSAAAQSSGGSDVQREIVNNIIQNIIQNVRDEIQRRRLVAPSRRLPLSGEAADFDNRTPLELRGESNPFAALAYTKAPPLAPADSQWLYGANLIGSDDQSYTFGTRIDTQTVTGAFDVTKIGIFGTTDALTFIGTGSNSWAHSFTGGLGLAGPVSFDSTTPAVSGTLSYLNGGFSADFSSIASWTSNSANLAFVAPADSSAVSLTGNAQYRFDFPYAVFIEPTAGVTYTEVYTSNFGTKIGDSTEVHGGARIGTEMKWMSYTVQPVLSGAVFQVVDVNTTALPGLVLPAAATPPQGLGGRGSAKITVLWTQNFSSYLEGHTSGVAGTKTIPAVAAVQTTGVQAGLRYTW